MLPRVKINYLNGLLGAAPESQDGLLMLCVIGAAAVSDTFALGTPYRIVRPGDLKPLGVTSTANARLVELVDQFYGEAEEGTPLYILGLANTYTMTTACNHLDGPLTAIIAGLHGVLRGIIVAEQSSASPTVTEGLDPDVFTALPKAQDLADYAASHFYSPIFVILEGRAYAGASSLRDLSSSAYNRVGIFIGDTKVGGTAGSPASTKNAAVGVLAGRIASVPVQRNIGRVADGPLSPDSFYLGAALVDDVMDDVETIYGKGYITPRIFYGQDGYFFNDDRLACAASDDYAHLTARRTVDKAARIAYLTLLQYLLDEIEVNNDGTMQAPVLKSWQASVEGAINRQMGAQGELSLVDGSGCVCFIDPAQNVLSTSKVRATLRVRPYGYARDIEVDLGFLTDNES
jgi:hypothetical protein